MISFLFSASFSTMWDKKRQHQFKGIRHKTINVKKDVNVSEMQNPVDFYG